MCAYCHFLSEIKKKKKLNDYFIFTRHSYGSCDLPTLETLSHIGGISILMIIIVILIFGF